MKFLAGSDNRGGAVTVKASRKGDARDSNYNLDPSYRYSKLTRTLSERDGSGGGLMEVTLETSSEFVGYRKENHECTGLTFKSKGTIKLPQDAASTALGVVQDSIALGFRVEQPGQVQLTASVVADLDVAVISLQGPSFPDPIKIYDDYDETLDITKPGEYILKGSYQLNVQLPNPGLGGRPISVEIQATLTAVP